MRIALIIVNYRSARLCADCLDSLAADAAADGGLQVEVLDGASGDDSVTQLREHVERRAYSRWCTITPLDQNGGFAFANNWALRGTLGSTDVPDFYLLLNPDTIVRPGAIQTLVEFLKSHPQAGVVGARLEHPDFTLHFAHKFPNILGEFELSARIGVISRLLGRWRIAPPPRDDAHRCDWVSGACMLVRREVFEQIGLLDEDFFMYFEDVDFCRRASRAGWECWSEPAARVIHFESQSSGVNGQAQQRRRLPAYWFAARRRYFEKHHGRLYRIAADIAWTLGQSTHTIYRRLRRRPNVDPPRVLRDFVSFSLRRSTSPR